MAPSPHSDANWKPGRGFSIAIGMATALLAWFATSAIRVNAGGPAVPLDDSYIHFQYARSIAELHPFRYTAGAAPTPGATSLLWPLVLAPFHALGFRGERIIWVAWALGFLSLALLAYETARLARGLMDRVAALGAGALVLAFGGFTWFAGSGMEVVPFAWLLTRTCARAAEWIEGNGPAATPPTYRELCVLGALCPLMRPEGIVGSGCVAAALLVAPRLGKRAYALPLVAAPLWPPLVGLLFTGQAVASTAVAKWLPLNPYFGTARLYAAVTGHLAILFGTLFDGRLWTGVFLPEGGRFVFAAAPLLLMVAGRVRGRLARGALVLAMATAIVIPTTYETFLVNRVRYIWPFVPAWFVGIAAMADLAGSAIRYATRRAASLEAQTSGAFVAGAAVLLALRIPPSIDDLASSSTAVTLQQVALGKWAKEALTSRSRLGVNDTGAIAYFSDHPTFDVVGLTTSGEARYWSAGRGSRFEHYERLPREALPEYFIVYPEWFDVPPLLGDAIESRTVEHTILGGRTMTAFVARYDLLNSGADPTERRLTDRRRLDALDVADIDDEAAHGYALFDATQAENVVLAGSAYADGGRLARTRDAFELKIAPGGLLVARLGASTPTVVAIDVNGTRVAEPTVAVTGWDEIVVPLPANAPRGSVRVLVQARSGTFASLHYWSYE